MNDREYFKLHIDHANEILKSYKVKKISPDPYWAARMTERILFVGEECGIIIDGKKPPKYAVNMLEKLADIIELKLLDHDKQNNIFQTMPTGSVDTFGFSILKI
jgi:hypothetical protein|tara:strand:- start:91 stop:402 length:312 start_codon:yes stop_codon:yes gene_type:complete